MEDNNKRPRRDQTLLITITLLVFCALIVIVTVVYFTYQQGQPLPRYVAVILVILFYGFIGYLLLLFFSYRILSPFERFNRDIREIAGDDYKKRLFIRQNDAQNVISFFTEVNSILDDRARLKGYNDDITSIVRDWTAELTKLANDDSPKDVITKSITRAESRLREVTQKWSEPPVGD